MLVELVRENPFLVFVIMCIISGWVHRGFDVIEKIGVARATGRSSTPAILEEGNAGSTKD